jgi:predicted AlkP superfamily phosphohydrolase/phosphomutase
MRRRTFVTGMSAAATALLFSPLCAPLRAWAGPRPRDVKVLCLGLDGMDPQLLRRFMAEGVMPHFSALAATGDLRACGTSTPPQSPVAWSNFITGRDPGGHGIFDFIHRRPDTMLPMLSLAETRPPARFLRMGQWKFPRTGGGVDLLRHGTPFWTPLTAAGVDVTIFKMPSNFPPEGDNVRSISGMGTPDILGTYGIFNYYTNDPGERHEVGGGRVVPVRPVAGRIATSIPGPPNPYREGNPPTAADFEVALDRRNRTALFDVGGAEFMLQEGEWSGWVTLHFSMIPHLREVTGLCRFYLMEAGERFRLYATPVQIDPGNPAMPISSPPGYARELAEATGPFYTQGLPDDTKALDEGIFSDGDYVGQADLVLAERLGQYRYELDRFRGMDRGFLFFYFNSLDQNSHMFWRSMDPASPRHADADPDHADRIRRMYRAMDGVLGQALTAVDERTVLFAVSDHGFAPYHRSFHANTWLLEHGYLALRPGVARADVAYLGGIDWTRTRAYALGINALYVNLRGRERHGVVAPGAERDALLEELVSGLGAVVDPVTGERPLVCVDRTDRVYHGPHAAAAPDLILGYRRGYRGSNASALGEVADSSFADNEDKWSGDHCMAAAEVPGILACNRPLAAGDASLLDMAPTFLDLFGLPPVAGMQGRSLLT